MGLSDALNNLQSEIENEKDQNIMALVRLHFDKITLILDSAKTKKEKGWSRVKKVFDQELGFDVNIDYLSYVYCYVKKQKSKDPSFERSVSVKANKVAPVVHSPRTGNPSPVPGASQSRGEAVSQAVAAEPAVQVVQGGSTPGGEVVVPTGPFARESSSILDRFLTGAKSKEVASGDMYYRIFHNNGQQLYFVDRDKRLLFNGGRKGSLDVFSEIQKHFNSEIHRYAFLLDALDSYIEKTTLGYRKDAQGRTDIGYGGNWNLQSTKTFYCQIREEYDRLVAGQ